MYLSYECGQYYNQRKEKTERGEGEQRANQQAKQIVGIRAKIVPSGKYNRDSVTGFKEII